MSKKCVLIVDDAKDILFLLTHSIKRLGPDYEVYTASDGPSALAQIKKQKFDLVITDYMMGGMTGLDLVESLKRISPDTQVVLMSAYDSTNLREKVKGLELSGYIGKPFTVDQVLEVVEQALAGTDRLPESTPTQSSVSNKALQDSLKMLYSKTGADYVLLLNSQGNPLQVVGRAEPATLSRLATFVATNFLAVTELASLLGDNSSVFKSSYYEGNNYNIYAHDVNGEYFLAVVFGAKDKPGTVWFYTKQAAATLAALLDQPSKPTTLNAGNPALVSEFDELLGSESVDDK